MNNGIERIAAERKRQKEVEGWTPEHDSQHDRGELALAAIAYASPLPVQTNFDPEGQEWSDPWPWSTEWDKRDKHDRIRQLEIAGALIAAELDRLLLESYRGEVYEVREVGGARPEGEAE